MGSPPPVLRRVQDLFVLDRGFAPIEGTRQFMRHDSWIQRRELERLILQAHEKKGQTFEGGENTTGWNMNPPEEARLPE
jgi:hypothetical protein